MIEYMIHCLAWHSTTMEFDEYETYVTWADFVLDWKLEHA